MFDLQALEAWLLERALEHDEFTISFAQAAAKLQADKIVRPGVTRLERLVAAVRRAAWRHGRRPLAAQRPCSRRGTRPCWMSCSAPIPGRTRHPSSGCAWMPHYDKVWASFVQPCRVSSRKVDRN